MSISSAVQSNFNLLRHLFNFSPLTHCLFYFVFSIFSFFPFSPFFLFLFLFSFFSEFFFLFFFFSRFLSLPSKKTPDPYSTVLKHSPGRRQTFEEGIGFFFLLSFFFFFLQSEEHLLVALLGKWISERFRQREQMQKKRGKGSWSKYSNSSLLQC